MATLWALNLADFYGISTSPHPATILAGVNMAAVLVAHFAMNWKISKEHPKMFSTVNTVVAFAMFIMVLVFMSTDKGVSKALKPIMWFTVAYDWIWIIRTFFNTFKCSKCNRKKGVDVYFESLSNTSNAEVDPKEEKSIKLMVLSFALVFWKTLTALFVLCLWNSVISVRGKSVNPFYITGSYANAGIIHSIASSFRNPADYDKISDANLLYMYTGVLTMIAIALRSLCRPKFIRTNKCTKKCCTYLSCSANFCEIILEFIGIVAGFTLCGLVLNGSVNSKMAVVRHVFVDTKLGFAPALVYCAMPLIDMFLFGMSCVPQAIRLYQWIRGDKEEYDYHAPTRSVHEEDT
eukprot:187943_1